MNRTLWRALALPAVFCAAMVFSRSGEAQTYPDKPVKIVVGFSAGSGPDVIARAIGAQLTNDFKQQFYIENKVGANGAVAIKSVVTSDPDGYSVLYSSSSISSVPHVYKSLGHDILTEFTPVATSGILDGYFMLVNPKLPATNVAEFIEYAKKNRVVYGSPGVGNVLHLAAEMFNLKAGVSMDHVPFRGASDVANALMAETIQVMFVTPPSVIGLVQAGSLRAIGFTGSKRFPATPDVPLVSETVPTFPVTGSWGMFYVPAKTPAAIVEKLNRAIRSAMRSPAVENVVVKAGYIPDERTPAETAAFFKSEVDASGVAVKAAKIVPN
ncbi:MAG: transporter substrate-binding protein [Hyphomicrobiales bacterium]|nr:transporter substrate-binding protein [Hyphomicrobiales bacterium]